MKKIFLPFLVSILFLSACSPSSPKTSSISSPTQVQKKNKLTQITFENPPQISLTPRTDGHELKLRISQIPANVSKLEYELLYKAIDGKTEIEKGLGDTINSPGLSLERDLLLGTSSCTNGCKYKYDDGITSGSLKITYLTNNSEVNIYESPWTLSKSQGKFLIKLEK